MTREPSDATKLRAARSEVAALTGMLADAEIRARTYRELARKAEQDAAEWKVRFDKLLSRDEVVR